MPIIAIAAESPSVSLKLFKLPPESIKVDIRMPTEPEGVFAFFSIFANAGVEVLSSTGRAII